MESQAYRDRYIEPDVKPERRRAPRTLGGEITGERSRRLRQGGFGSFIMRDNRVSNYRNTSRDVERGA